jgi:hypothetical protein
MIAGVAHTAYSAGWSIMRPGGGRGIGFNVCACDCVVVPALTPGQQRQIADGCLLLGAMTRSFIRRHLGYRYGIHPDGAAALAAERTVRAGSLAAGKPFLNPL